MELTDSAKFFYACDGKVLKSLHELSSVLPNMSDATYKYHANDSKNDFSNWIEFVIGNKRLADSLKGKSKKEVEKLLRKAAKR